MQYYINEPNSPVRKPPHTQRHRSLKQNQVRDISKSFFDEFFKPDQFLPLITRGQTFLIQILAKSSSYFHRNITKHYKRTLIFLANYHKLMQIYSLKYNTPITNDMALNFIILLGYSRLKDNQIDEAKNVFKNVWQYVDIKSCDKLMISIALSNLTFLHLNNKKNFKALQSGLKCIQIMGMHLGMLKKQSLRSQMVQDSVILINSLILCRKALSKINQFDPKKFYIELQRYINQIGYKCSKKYLGEQSDFTKVFSNFKNYNRLPVYLQVEEQSLEKTTMEQKILQQLEGIYQVLKTKRQPEIVYVAPPPAAQPPPPPPKQPSIVEPEPVQESETQIMLPEQPPADVEDQTQASEPISFNTNGWAIQGHMLRSKVLAQKMAISGEFVLGILVLQYSKKRKQMKEVISNQRLQKILAMIDYETSVLYEHSLKRLTDKEFLNYIIFPHIDIDQQGHLEFMLQKKSVINPFQTTFLSTKSLIFINHILGTNLRIRISAFQTSLSVYINVELRQATFAKLFEMKQQLPDLIHSVYQKIKQSQYQKQIEIPQLIKHESTQVIVKNQDLLKKTLSGFLKDFQVFLSEVQQQEDENLKFQDFLSNYQSQLSDTILVTFTEAKPNPKSPGTKSSQKVEQVLKIKGRFNFCKYISNIHSFQIFCQNNYPTFDLDSQSHAKGTMTVYGDKFEADFGIPVDFFEKNNEMKSILEIISKRYELKMFYSPLRTHDQELYNQNAIFELPLICKSYRRTAVEDENGFMVMVTISHLTVNNEVPLAFKVDVYFPSEGCAQYSILIKLQPSIWQKPTEVIKKQETKQVEKGKQNDEDENKENEKMISQDYGFKKDYFLIEWCELQGYDRLMKFFSIEDMKILVKGSQLRFYSLERLFYDFK